MFNIKVNLIKGNILSSLLLFAIPIFFSNLLQQAYNTIDIMIVGKTLGEDSLAAIGATSSVYELMVGFAMGIGNGLSIVTARNYGSGDQELVKRSVAGTIVIGIFVTGFLMIVSQLFLFSGLELLDTPSDIIQEAYSYISIITMFVGVLLSYNLCSGLLRATGNSVMPLLFLLVATILNIFLDLLFIVKFDMGIKGAAIATVIAKGVSVLLSVIYIYIKCPYLIPSKKHFTFHKKLYKDLVGQGLSMGLMMSIVFTGSLVLQKSINGMGKLVIAAHIAARKLNSFSLMPVTSIAASLSTFVSQNKGADQRKRIMKSIKYANLLAILWGAIISCILLFAAPLMVEMISGSKEAVIIDNGSRYLMLNAPFYAVLGVLFNLRYSLQGIGEKVVPLISSIIELLGKIIFVIFLIPTLDYLGVILCEPVIWCFMCVQLLYSFYTNSYIRQNKKVNL